MEVKKATTSKHPFKQCAKHCVKKTKNIFTDGEK